MLHVVLVEPNSLRMKDIKNALAELDKEFSIFEFANVESFYEAFKNSVETDTNQNSDGEDAAVKEGSVENIFSVDKVGLIVADYESCKTLPFSFWRKLLTFFDNKRQGEFPTRLFLTIHGDDENKEQLLSDFDPCAFNILIKPFDHLLVVQNIKLALQSPKPLSPQEIYFQKIPGRVEIIKEIKLTRLTELGFRTDSRRPIETGKTARYFGEALQGFTETSVFARCYSCTNDEDPDNYKCSFTFLGADNTHLSEIRKAIAKSGKKFDLDFPQPNSVAKVNLLVVSWDREYHRKLNEILNERFGNIEVDEAASMFELQELLGAAIRLEGEDTPMLTSKAGSFFIEVSEDLEQINSIFQLVESELPEPKPEVEIDDDSSQDEPDKDKEPAKPKLEKEDLEYGLGMPSAQLIQQTGYLRKIIHSDDYEALKTVIRAGGFSGERQLRLEINSIHCYRVRLLSVASNEGNFCLELDPLEEAFEFQSQNRKEYDACIVDGTHVPLEFGLMVKNTFTETLDNKGVKFFYLSPDTIHDYEQIDRAEAFEDWLKLPVDVYYFTRKLKMHISALNMKDADNNKRSAIDFDEVVYTGLPQKLLSVSEVHVSFLYYRELAPGAKRYIRLWHSEESYTPSVLAVCTSCISAEDNQFQCDFLFIGTTPADTKAIRLWIRQNYSRQKMAKQKSSG